MEGKLNIRTMRTADLGFAAICTEREGWAGETRQSFEGFLAYDPNGCFLAEVGGQPTGICVATFYGQYGFIGELIVNPESRGRGLGCRLLDHAIGYLQGRGARSIYLDGVQTAISLYERAGFRKICLSLRFGRILSGGSHPQVRRMASVDLDQVARLDEQVFGADRSFFLRRKWSLFPKLCRVVEHEGEVAGYIFGWRGKGMLALGPWVVLPQIDRPDSLLESLASETPDAKVTLGVLESNVQAVNLLRSLGFTEGKTPPWRMVLGPSQRLGDSPCCYGLGSPAKG